MGGGNGLYCFKLTFEPQNAVATLADDPTAPSQGVGFIKVAVPPTPTFTCATISKPNAVVETGNETAVNAGSSAGGYAFYVYWTVVGIVVEPKSLSDCWRIVGAMG